MIRSKVYVYLLKVWCADISHIKRSTKDAYPVPTTVRLLFLFCQTQSHSISNARKMTAVSSYICACHKDYGPHVYVMRSLINGILPNLLDRFHITAFVCSHLMRVADGNTRGAMMLIRWVTDLAMWGCAIATYHIEERDFWVISEGDNLHTLSTRSVSISFA